MNKKSYKSLYLIGIIGIVVVAAMVFAITSAFNVQSSNTANAAVLVTSLQSQDGYMYDSSNNIIDSAISGYELGSDDKYHMTSAQITTVYGSSVTTISTASGLLSFINNATSSSIGVLTSDIDYNMPSLGVVASSKEFEGILDGNAYTINITPCVGGTHIDDNFVTGYAASLFGSSRNYYYTGMLMGSNKGTIKNLNIDFLKNTSGALSVNASLTSSNGTLINRSSYSSGNDVPTVAGVLCGLNYGGTIQNCTLTLTGAFAVGQAARYNGVFDSRTQVQYNSCIVGGMVGALYSGTVTRCTLDNEGGVLALADGSRDGVGNKTAGAIAGGMVGVMYNGAGATIYECSLMGKGAVIGMCGHDVTNRNNDGCWGYSGGLVAGDVYIQETSLATRDLAANQVTAIISAWTGARTNIWKSSSDSIEIKTINGALYDYVGGNGGVANNVLLFDYIQLLQDNGSSYTTLDSNGVLTYGSWAEIYAVNDGGSLTVSFDYTKTDGKPIRVEAIAQGYTPEDIATTKTNTNYEFESGQKGRFIWSVTEYESAWHSGGAPAVAPTDNYAAQLLYVSSSRSGALAYAFGEKATLTYINNNTSINATNYITDTSKYYDGNEFIMPEVVVTRSNNDTITINDSAYSFDINYTIFEGTDDEATYNFTMLINNGFSVYYDLPGKYVIQPKITIDTKRYLYYDDSAYVLVDYDENDTSSIFTYYINNGRGSLFNASCESNSITWLQQDTILFNYANTANTIDYYAYQVGNAAETEKIAMTADEVNGTISATESGKYYYIINAYLTNPYWTSADTNTNREYFKVASTSVQVFIDTLAPTIENVKYYVYDATASNYKGTQITTFELEEWQYDDVLVEYQVRDANLSGVVSGSGHISYTQVSDSRWDCYAKLTGANPSQQVTYQDAAGNVVSQTFTAKIDTTQIELTNVKALNRNEYLSYYAQLGYCPITVKISFTPVFGAAGAHLEYSYEQDSNNEDIWVVYDRTLKANQPNTFIIDFELNNQNLKMRLVSDENMYADSYANEDGYVRNGADNDEESKLWNIKIIIAGIGITLDNLFYEDTALSSMTNEELNVLFNKTYNASNLADVTLSAKVYQTGTTLIDDTIVIYSDQYLYTEPDIVETSLDVKASFEKADAGTWNVTISVDSVGDYYNKYLVRFLTRNAADTAWNTTTNLETLTTVNETFTIEKLVATSTIAKATLNVNLSDYTDQLSNSYAFGDTIPSQIIIAKDNVTLFEDVTLNLITDAKITKDESDVLIYPAVGNYDVDAEFATANNNYNLSVTTMQLTISKKNVIVTSMLDGSEAYNTTITFDGLTHAITGTYKDIYNQTQSAKITYYTDASCQTKVSEEEIAGVTLVGTYYAKIEIANANYNVANTGNPVKFTITKGYLNLNLDTQTIAFAGRKLGFEIKTTVDVDKKYYQDGSFTVSYYKVSNGVADLTTEVDPFDVGTYLVQITFKDCTYFYDKNYDDTYLVVEKASTKIELTDVHIAYDGEEHNYTLESANIKITANNGATSVVLVEGGVIQYYTYANQVIVKTQDVSSVLELRVFNETTRGYDLIDLENPAKYTNAGEYQMRVSFKGDSCFSSSSATTTFEIDKAKFEGITYESVKFNYVDSAEENYHTNVIKGEALQNYLAMGATLKYTYIGVTYIDKGVLAADVDTNTSWEIDKDTDYETNPNPLKFNGVGVYTISARLSMANYEDLFLTADIEIDKATMPKVTPQSIEEVYNGTFHPGVFTIDTSLELVYYYIAGYENVKWIDYIQMGADKIYVDYDDDAAPVDVGEYYGKITLTSDSYADEVIDVHIVITAKQVEDVSFTALENIIDSLDSSTNLSKLKAKFRDVNGDETTATFEYYKKNANGSIGEKVELNSDGTLEAGEYIVKIAFNGGNYYTEQFAEITIAQASSNNNGNNSGNGGGSGSSYGSLADIFNQYRLYIIVGGAVIVVVVILGIILGVVRGKSKAKRKGKKKRARKPEKTRKEEKPRPKKNNETIKPNNKAQF